MTDTEVPEKDLAGPFARMKDGNKGLVAWSDTKISAYLFLSIVDGLEIPLQLQVNTAPLLTHKALFAMFKSWEPSATDKPLTVRAIRGVPVAKMLAESRRIDDATSKDSEEFGFNPVRSFHFEDGRKLGFKSNSAFFAAIDQAYSAVIYDLALQQGIATPMKEVAKVLCDGDARRARNLITAARRNGYLSKGDKDSGRSSSHASKQAFNLIDAIQQDIDAIRKDQVRFGLTEESNDEHQ